MKTCVLSSWLEFENSIRDLNSRRKELESKNNRSFDVPLFRGLGSSEWSLKTTLERAYPLEAAGKSTDLPSYYRQVYASKSAIETLTDRQWDGVPEPLKFEDRLQKFSSIAPRHFFARKPSIYRYFVYLRHHGFPSPLLDWTASHYIAAFFAFDSIARKDEAFVSVYAMLHDGHSFHSAEMPYVTILGPLC